MSESLHLIVEGAGPLVRRRIVVWRRLEPGDVRTQGSLDVPESPFLEAKVVDIAIPRALHEEMKTLATAHAKATSLSSSPLLEYEPAGLLLSAAGGIGVDVWLDYLRPVEVFQWIALGCLVVGTALGMYAKQRRRAEEARATARWASAPERSDHEKLSRDIGHAWLRFTQALKKDSGFHTDVRVAEGSNDPLRLASIDPRLIQTARGFDPEDWMPTEGGGVRYEALHAAGEIVSRLLPGATELAEEGARTQPEPDEGARAAPSPEA